MDFTFTEEQETISKMARELFERRATPERLTELEAGDTRYDAALWQELAAADLLGAGLPESVGGNGGGFVELGCCWPRWVGRWLRCRPTRPWCWGQTRSRGMALRSNSSGSCPASSPERAS